MSEQQKTPDGHRFERTDLHDAVLAADDTGMVRNEADIVTAELLEPPNVIPVKGTGPEIP